MSGVATWDAPRVHHRLFELTGQRAKFRFRRLLRRLRSPRRMIATTLAIVFFAAYILNGIYILSAREPADPARLSLWLSGGMVIYAMYHWVRCVWTQKVADLEFTSAEKNWLGGAPVQRSSLAMYHVTNVMFASLMKAFLLAVVLMFDVNHIELLILGVFASLVLLETIRLIIQRWSSSLNASRMFAMRIAATAIVIAVGLQLIARVLAATPSGSPPWLYIVGGFGALGQTASCDVIQWLSFPWVASSRLAVAESYSAMTFLYLVLALIVTPLAIFFLVSVDHWAGERRLKRDRQRFADGNYGRDASRQTAAGKKLRQKTELPRLIEDLLPAEVAALMSRQAVSIRRYRGTILFSFFVPTLLCLSPLFTGQVTEQWFYVVGGIAMCTLLLAPPALRLDFRRDLKRMLLLRSLPIRPLPIVIGQLSLPIAITLTFQWITLAIAAYVTSPGISQILLWTGMLNALAVFTFASENALFLAYPHHEHTQGIGMMIRAKLTFLGKFAAILGALALLVAWSLFCKSVFSGVWIKVAVLVGAVSATWTIALLAVAAAAWTWRRFDLSYDMPPE